MVDINPTVQRKLTTITVNCRGKSITTFVELDCVDGKPVASSELINAILMDLGCCERGATYSIG